ncbi:MAG TPA: DUF4260 domain-containing protein [Ureibacillus sp.]|nr:DUF4260 domain-containing protein [Ureibacillus sp.]
MIKSFIKIEGLVVFLASIYLYYSHHFSWLLFLILLLVPDISMVGYFINKKVGANIYNVFHSYSIPIVLYVIGMMVSVQTLVMVSLIWIAHIGMDRLLGYGLKYDSDFKDTHIQRI